ncbi:DUF624 domain-containing protein [Chloroflexota bacterium]
MGQAITVIKNTMIEWYHALIMLFMLNLMLLACSLTIVLLPPALAALYTITGELAYGQSLGFGDYLRAMRQYFVKSWLWALLNIAVFAILGSNMAFYSRMAASWATIPYTIFLLLGLYWFIFQVYFWPYMMKQEEPSIRTALRNTLLTSLASPGFTLVIVAVSLLILGLSALFVFPILLGTATLVALLGSMAVRNRVETYTDKKQAQPEE